MTREYPEAYLWSMHDPDTVFVLVPLGEAEYETWKVIRIRIDGLYSPERYTPEGKALREEIQRRLFVKWMRVSVTRGKPTFNRWVGTIKFADGSWWADKVRAIMDEMEIVEGGAGASTD